MVIHTRVPRIRTRRPTPAQHAFRGFFGADLDAWLDAFWSDLDAPAETAWPPVDVTDDADAVVLSAELPGLGAENFEVLVEDDVLTIRGRRRRGASGRGLDDAPDAPAFARSFRLPFEVEADTVSGRYRNGVLTLTVPRPGEPGSQVRSVPVTTG